MDTIWQLTLDDAMRTRPLVDDDLVYAGGDSGLSVIDAETGDRRRHIPFDHWIRETPCSIGETICLYVNDDSFTDGGVVYALDGPRGVEHWSIQCGERIDAIAATRDVACYGWDRQVQAVGLEDGTERWHFDNRSLEADSQDQQIQALAADDEQVYVATFDGDVRALDADSGDVHWRFNIESRPTMLAADDGMVYAGSHGDAPAVGDPVCYALRAETGEPRWHLSQDVGLNEPTRNADALVVTSYDHVYAVDVESGEVFWDRSTSDGATNPIVMDDRVYVGTDDGTLSVYDLYDGSSKSSHRLERGDVQVEHLGGAAGLLVAAVTDTERFDTTLHAISVPYDPEVDTSTSADTTDSATDTPEESCPSCGAKVTAKGNFCPECGHELHDPTCPSCDEGLTGDEAFCPACGKELPE